MSVGRPTKYDSKIHPQVAGWLARHGYIDLDLAEAMGINITTLKEWKRKHKEFQAALKQDKNFTDSLVEDSLYKRAMGYEYSEVCEETVILKSKRTDIKMPGIKRKTTTKQVIPDVTAQIFWLKNRQRDKWRDRLDHELTGKNGGPIETVDYRLLLIKKLRLNGTNGNGNTQDSA